MKNDKQYKYCTADIAIWKACKGFEDSYGQMFLVAVVYCEIMSRIEGMESKPWN